MKKFDIVFYSTENISYKGFRTSFSYCKDYIDQYNGTDHSYFKNFKGGNVGVMDLETAKVVYTTKVC